MYFGIAPVRLSFAGGGTDVPEYFEEYGGAVVSTSISRFTYVMINPRQDNNFQIFSPEFQAHNIPMKFEELEPKVGTELAVSTLKYMDYKKGSNVMMSSDVPPRSGLGSSSSLTVNLVNTISHIKKTRLTKAEIAETAFKISREILHWPLGKQDEYVAAFGGLNLIAFDRDKIKVTPITLSSKLFEELEKNLMLFFIGGRTSSEVLSNQLQRIKDKNKETLEALGRAKELAHTINSSLNKSDLTNFGELLHQGWMNKRKSVKGITNEVIDKIYDTALKHGALGGKLTGAGAGGHILLYCEQPKQKAVSDALTQLGLTDVRFGLHKEGAKILNLYDY